jgi:hypothetical protein
MSDRKFLKAAEGRTVRQEDSGEPWPTEGAFAENTRYVRRRVADGDLVEAQPPKPARPAADGDKK